jgi:hypothetical protein
MENIKLVRPDDAGPKISVIPPRGRPPVNVSISSTPVERVSTTGFLWILNASPKRLGKSTFENAVFIVYVTYSTPQRSRARLRFTVGRRGFSPVVVFNGTKSRSFLNPEDEGQH